MPPRAKTAAPSSRQTISRQLREIIRGRGLTAYALGQKADIESGIIRRFLCEERDIKLDTLDRLADVLGLRLAEGSRGRGRPSRSAKAGRPAETQPDPDTAAGPSQPEPPRDEPAGPGAEVTSGPPDESDPPEVPAGPAPSDPAKWSGDPDESDPPESPGPIGAGQEQPWWDS